MAQRGAHISRISGKAVCCGCGGECFEIIIYNDSSHDVVCLEPDCRQVWAPLGQGCGTISRISEAVGEGRVKQSDMVSKT